jgi:ribonuclease HII
MQTLGLDEVGRGCWAGPLVAAAVVLDPKWPVKGLNDSKKLSRLQRERLAVLIESQALAFGTGWVGPEAIDISGITNAVKTAMQEAYSEVMRQLGKAGAARLELAVIIDGNYNFMPGVSGATTLVGADGSVPEVGAASIIAKVARDEYMYRAAVQYPGYGFERHVGYGTAQHIAALARNGVTPLHRRSFKPVRNILLQSDQ